MRNRELLKSLVAQGKPAAAAKPVKA